MAMHPKTAEELKAVREKLESLVDELDSIREYEPDSLTRSWLSDDVLDVIAPVVADIDSRLKREGK